MWLVFSDYVPCSVTVSGREGKDDEEDDKYEMSDRNPTEGQYEDPDEEAFKEKIMAQLEENAFKVEEACEEAHNILTLQFGTRAGDAVKDAVLEEW